MYRVFVAAVLGLIAQPATADISWKTDRIAQGSLLVLQNDDGTVFTHLKQGEAQGQVRFDTFAGESPAAPFVGSYMTTRRGEITKTISIDGEVTEFVPHRCMRTVGECRYTIVHPDGYREGRVRVTRETADGLSWREFSSGGLVQTGALGLDHLGSATGGWREDGASGQRVRTRRVMAVYR